MQDGGTPQYNRVCGGERRSARGGRPQCSVCGSVRRSVGCAPMCRWYTLPVHYIPPIVFSLPSLVCCSPFGTTSSGRRRVLRPKLLATCRRHLLCTEIMPRAEWQCLVLPSTLLLSSCGGCQTSPPHPLPSPFSFPFQSPIPSLFPLPFPSSIPSPLLVTALVSVPTPVLVPILRASSRLRRVCVCVVCVFLHVNRSGLNCCQSGMLPQRRRGMKVNGSLA